MDADIQFGDVEEARPEVHLRPDRNKHYAVVPHAAPREEDLPIFVDLDVMRDMEAHALEDTSVELGGVLLGGQYEDEDGHPFVVVTDSLRAQHYEATKGSFKFTHDTWEQISRERDEFPEDLQMVGWYHTHPDWGVFLSGMDMFICDNFFNRPLDLALVIDPCRRDRGMFMWTGDPQQRIRRTGGFYFIASRFRRHELEIFTCQLEGKLTMSSDPRFIAGQVGPSAPPVVNIAEPRNPWQGPVIMGMLTMQFMVICLIAWQLIAPKPEDQTEIEKQNKQIAELERSIKALTRDDYNETRLSAQREMLRSIASEMKGGPGLVDAFEDLKGQLRESKAANAGHNAVTMDLKSQVADLKQEKKTLQNRFETEEDKRKTAEKNLGKTKEDLTAKKTEIAKLEEKLGIGSDKKGSETAPKEQSWLAYITVGVIVVVLALVGIGAAVAMRKEEDEEEEEDYKDSSEESDDKTNNNSE